MQNNKTGDKQKMGDDVKKRFIDAMLSDSSMIATANKIKSMRSICSHCLGRQFAKISSGLTNDERGDAIRNVILKDKKTSFFKKSKKEHCRVCCDIFDETKKWAKKGVKKAGGTEFETFLVGTKMSGLIAENEEMLWASCGTQWAEPLKQEMNREVGKLIVNKTHKTVNFERPDVVILLDLESGGVDLQINSLFILGKYRKMVRGIPQTHWPCRECGGAGCKRCNFTGKMYQESVEELIENSVLELYEAKDLVFHGSGREDIDARMLGTGRPFVMEIISPLRRKADLRRVEGKINKENPGKIEVSGLQYVEKRYVEQIKNAKFDKVYRIRFSLASQIPKDRVEAALVGLKGIIKQKTPARVLHRRGDLIRERRVKDARLLSFEKDAEAEIWAESGLYIKELLTGDSGRTKPSLAELLGCEVTVSELDVIEVKDGQGAMGK